MRSAGQPIIGAVARIRVIALQGEDGQKIHSRRLCALEKAFGMHIKIVKRRIHHGFSALHHDFCSRPLFRL